MISCLLAAVSLVGEAETSTYRYGRQKAWQRFSARRWRFIRSWQSPPRPAPRAANMFLFSKFTKIPQGNTGKAHMRLGKHPIVGSSSPLLPRSLARSSQTKKKRKWKRKKFYPDAIRKALSPQMMRKALCIADHSVPSTVCHHLGYRDSWSEGYYKRILVSFTLRPKEVFSIS